MNIQNIINKVSSGTDLDFEESKFCMNEIMSGELLPSQFGVIMASLAIKGETFEEIAGMAAVMREFSIKIKGKENAIDVCGTGGSGLKWFNISTASAIVVASYGIPVAKHGNRAASGNSGSADVLEELGIKISLEPKVVEKCLHEIDLTFIFAQTFHPSMKYAAPLRKEIGIRTIFNFLGELEVSSILAVGWDEKLIQAEVNSHISEFNVGMAYPNPFNPAVKIDYSTKTDGNIDISVFNIRGKFIETIKNDFINFGSYEVTWEPKLLPSGVYLIKFVSGNDVHYRQVIYLK